jgi:hypothetical protein
MRMRGIPTNFSENIFLILSASCFVGVRHVFDFNFNEAKDFVVKPSKVGRIINVLNLF